MFQAWFFAVYLVTVCAFLIISTVFQNIFLSFRTMYSFLELDTV